MIITSLEKFDNLPLPALGLLPAIHDIAVDDVQDVAASSGVTAVPFVFPSVISSRGSVFRNTGVVPIVIPSSSNWPAKTIYPGEHFGCDGRFFYPVFNKEGTVSYYPKSFERVLYSFAHDYLSFPVGSSAEIYRLVYLRLVANNTTAIWNIVFECGETVSQLNPSVSYIIRANVTAGSSVVHALDPINNIGHMWQIEGDGIPYGANYKTLVKQVDLSLNTIEMTRPANDGGVFNLKISRPTGPNIGEIQWLPPMLEQQIHITELLSRNSFGAKLEKMATISDETSVAGFKASVFSYGKEWNPPMESLPTTANFVFRMRLGYFDTENIPDPRGYLGYLVRTVPNL